MNAQTRQTTSRLALPDSLLTAAEQVQKRTVMRIVKNNLYVKNDSVMISPLAKDSICEASGEETYQVLVNNVEDRRHLTVLKLLSEEVYLTTKC